MIKIVIADDVEIVRNGLKVIIEQDEEIVTCGLAENGNSAYNLCKDHMPDIVLMDMQMPKCDGESATMKIKRDFPQIKVLVLTTFNDKHTLSKALASGADGYILKGVDENKLSDVIKSTVRGVNIFGSTVFQNIKNTFVETKCDNAIRLTERETELLVLVAQGHNNKEISEKMFLSEGTVRNNISALLHKLKLRDRTQIAVYAVKNNYI